MRRGLGHRRLLALCAGAILVSVGVAYAAIPHSHTGVINGCYEKKTGILRVIDAQAGKHCLSFETPISWNQKGPKGDTGAAGPSGAQGPAGPQGSAGAAGPQGPAGPQGQQGPPGADGAPGAAGADGDDGEDGAQGPPGAAGADGDDGEDGADGAQGPPGASGPQGPAGPQGPQGSPGGAFAGNVCSPNGLFCLEIKNNGVFIKRAGKTVLKVTLSDVELAG